MAGRQEPSYWEVSGTYRQHPPHETHRHQPVSQPNNPVAYTRLPRLPSLTNWQHTDARPTVGPPQPSPTYPSSHSWDTYRPQYPVNEPQSATQTRTDFPFNPPQHPRSAIDPRPSPHPFSASQQIASQAPVQPDMCFRGRSHGYDELPSRPVSEKQVLSPLNTRAAYDAGMRSPQDRSSRNSYMKSPVTTPDRPDKRYRSMTPPSHSTKRHRDVSPPGMRAPDRVVELLPNLLGEDKVHLHRKLKFSMRIRQQPKSARSCGFADKDRRAIDPPPIVQLMIEGDGLSEEDIDTYLYHDRWVMCCTLVDDKGLDATNLSIDDVHCRRLMGEFTAVAFVGTDENGEMGSFFCFNDLSCRTPGDFRLSFSVTMLPRKSENQAGIRYPNVSHIMSNVFTAYNAKLFPGMTESSALAKALKFQGCNVTVRKGNKGKNSLDDDDGDEY